jgi:hypothetical protein
MEKKPISKVIWGIGAFLLIWAIIGGMLMSRAAKDFNLRAYTAAEIQQITTAVNLYSTNATMREVDSPSIFRALAGSNSTHTAYLVSKQTNAEGEVLDYWKTPYRIEKSGPTNFSVRSAGKNKIYGDGDDLVSDQLTK